MRIPESQKAEVRQGGDEEDWKDEESFFFSLSNAAEDLEAR